jgi:hypothetical protein
MLLDRQRFPQPGAERKTQKRLTDRPALFKAFPVFIKHAPRKLAESLDLLIPSCPR